MFSPRVRLLSSMTASAVPRPGQSTGASASARAQGPQLPQYPRCCVVQTVPRLPTTAKPMGGRASKQQDGAVWRIDGEPPPYAAQELAQYPMPPYEEPAGNASVQAPAATAAAGAPSAATPMAAEPPSAAVGAGSAHSQQHLIPPMYAGAAYGAGAAPHATAFPSPTAGQPSMYGQPPPPYYQWQPPPPSPAVANAAAAGAAPFVRRRRMTVVVVCLVLVAVGISIAVVATQINWNNNSSWVYASPTPFYQSPSYESPTAGAYSPPPPPSTSQGVLQSLWSPPPAAVELSPAPVASAPPTAEPLFLRRRQLLGGSPEWR